MIYDIYIYMIYIYDIYIYMIHEMFRCITAYLDFDGISMKLLETGMAEDQISSSHWLGAPRSEEGDGEV